MRVRSLCFDCSHLTREFPWAPRSSDEADANGRPAEPPWRHRFADGVTCCSKTSGLHWLAGAVNRSNSERQAVETNLCEAGLTNFLSESFGCGKLAYSLKQVSIG